VRAWHVTAIEELELSSREADELPGREEPLDEGELSAVAELLTVAELPAVAELSIVSELSVPLLSEEFSSMSGLLTLALLLSSQAASVKVSAAAASPQANLMKFFFMAFLPFLLVANSSAILHRITIVNLTFRNPFPVFTEIAHLTKGCDLGIVRFVIRV
jgi:hypothetical protein